VRTIESADLTLFWNAEFSVKVDHLFNLPVDQAARHNHNAVIISDFHHEGARRDQRCKIEVVEFSKHSEIVLVDDLWIESVRSSLCEVGRFHVPVVKVSARDDYLKTGFSRPRPERGVTSVGKSVKSEPVHIDIRKRAEVIKQAAELLQVHA